MSWNLSSVPITITSRVRFSNLTGALLTTSGVAPTSAVARFSIARRSSSVSLWTPDGGCIMPVVSVLPGLITSRLDPIPISSERM